MILSRDVVRYVILPYMIKPPMKLRDWIPLDKIDWESLSGNNSDGAIELLREHLINSARNGIRDKINWYGLSANLLG